VKTPKRNEGFMVAAKKPPTKTVNAPPRLKPISTREYGKTRNYQQGGDVTPTAEQLAQQTTQQLSQTPTADQLAATSEKTTLPTLLAKSR
jgi:hypothetical protein